MGNGTRRQNYLYVGDIARCLELSLVSERVHGVYNLTSDLLLSNLELARIVIKTLGSSSQIAFDGVDPADDYVWDASIDKIKSDAGYIPAARIEDVVREYAEWAKREGLQ